MRHFLMVAMVAVWGSVGARADSEGAGKAWPKVVEGFAKALVEGDRAGVEGAMAAKNYVRRFDSHEFEAGAAALLERAGKATLVGQHGYYHPPLVMAADVAADFKNATAVPEKVRTQFMIDDPAEIKRANATAVQWVVEQLEAKQGQPLAVIVLWAKKVAAEAKEEGKKQEKAAFEPVFVLVRGEESEGQKFRINYVVYGNPVPENP